MTGGGGRVKETSGPPCPQPGPPLPSIHPTPPPTLQDFAAVLVGIIVALHYSWKGLTPPTHPLPPLQNFATVMVGVIVAFNYSWKMTLVVLACTPLLVGAGFAMARKSVGTSKAVRAGVVGWCVCG